MARQNTKIGDIFFVELKDKVKKYFQLIAIDSTQLNSDVIRAFKKEYPVSENPDLMDVIKGEVDFYIHCVTKLGLRMSLWEKAGNNAEIGSIKNILFRDTNDYGIKTGEVSVRFSNNWYVWHINDEDFTQIGKLDEKTMKTEVGIIINPLGVIELLKGNKYPVNYPEF